MERKARFIWCGSVIVIALIMLVLLFAGGGVHGQSGPVRFCSGQVSELSLAVFCYGRAIEEMPLHVAVYECDKQPSQLADPFTPWGFQCSLVRPAVAPPPTPRPTATPIPSGHQHQQFYPHIYSAN